MNKIKNIEFLRIIGCISIVLIHTCRFEYLSGTFPDIDFYRYLQKITSNGQKAVDLFFMLSGLFFSLKLDLKKTCFTFIKHKVVRLYPTFIFMLTLSFIFSLFHIVDFKFYDTVFALLGLTGTSLVLSHGTAELSIYWYVSAMLWVLLLFFYLRKYFDQKVIDLIIAVSIVFSYSFIILL